jgi:hypothetical protein
VNCPSCNAESEVVDSRKAGTVESPRSNASTSPQIVRRRRNCPACKERFTTYELPTEAFHQTIQVEITTEMFNGALRSHQTTRYICECGNEARYCIANNTAPRYCGICDIIKNGGTGVRFRDIIARVEEAGEETT